jgi:membrane peptidoglycan carboxypeptidase
MNLPAILQQRNRRKQTPAYRNAGFGCGLLISLGLAGIVLGLAAGYMWAVADLPSLENLPILLDEQTGRLYQPTRLYDRTGEQIILSLENPAAAGWQVLSLDQSQANYLPDEIVDATLATVDPTFWENRGYSLINITQDTHPTLAQSFVYQLFLRTEPPGIRRIVREQILAAQVIKQYGHSQVLEWYLNTTRYGPWIYGVDAAARVYFNKPAINLSYAEAAFLVAMAENPQADPWDLSQEIITRQLTVIQAMLLQSRIGADEAMEASQAELELGEELTIPDLAPDFSRLALAQLADQFPNDDMERGGWKIITTLDIELQLQVDCATSVQLARLRGQPEPTQTLDGSSCRAAQLLPTLPAGQSGSGENVAASVLVLDPRLGQILAMVGDITTIRPAGSLLTPLVYLSAFTRGSNPASLVWDVPPTPDPLSGDQSQVSNASGTYLGPMRLRHALTNDVLQPALNYQNQIGQEVLLLTTEQLGLSALVEQARTNPGFDFIQSGQVSLADITKSLGIFSNTGILAGQPSSLPGPENQNDSMPLQTTYVIRVQDADQTTWLEWSTPQSQSVITQQLAYLMNHALSDEPARWPSLGHPNPLEIGRPAAAKLGTTLQGLDTWAVGYTPQLVVGAWMGKTGLTPGALISTPVAGLWHAVIQYASQDKPVQNWTVPAGVSFVDVCDPSGLLPTAYCPTVVTEVFLTGSEPTQIDFLYQAFQVNRETGRLATVFTPTELVEEKIYMVVPPEAAAWAQNADIPTPPDTYDAIFNPTTSELASFSSPAMFAHVSGEVEFTGTASGEDFAYFRLQVGQGLNPQSWVQIGEDVQKPVEDGLLGTWDARNLSGLFAVQLLVIKQDQRVERAIMQVTVDNQAPQVEILSPLSDQVIHATTQAGVVLQVSVQDNLEVDRVELYIDRQLIALLNDAPYMIAWEAEPGEHTLIARAVDLAGNVSEAGLKFEVK